MKLEAPDVLESMRGMAKCEACDTYGPVVGHHYLVRRAQVRIDHPFNLIALCSKPGGCHDKAHWSVEPDLEKFKFLDIVAKREGVMASTIQEFLQWLSRTDKDRPVGPQVRAL